MDFWNHWFFLCVKIWKRWLNFKVLGNQARPNGFAREVRRVASQRHVEWRCWSSSRVYRESRSFGGPVLLCLSLYVGRDGHTTMAMEVLVRRTTPRLLNLVPVCTRPNRTVRKEKHDRSSKTWRLRKSTWVKILIFFKIKNSAFLAILYGKWVNVGPKGGIEGKGGWHDLMWKTCWVEDFLD